MEVMTTLYLQYGTVHWIGGDNFTGFFRISNDKHKEDAK